MEPGIYSAVGTNAGESDLNLPADNPKCFLMYTWLITTITINSEQELKLKLIKNKPNKLWANCEARTVERELRSANCGTWAAERESTGSKAILKKCSQICIRDKKKCFKKIESNKLNKHSRKKLQPPEYGPDLEGLWSIPVLGLYILARNRHPGWKNIKN